MKDLLLFYYNEKEKCIPENFEEILEVCNLNTHFFTTSFLQKRTLRYLEEQLSQAQTHSHVQREYMGILICGVALYFKKQNDIYNSSTLFELALPSSNIVALVEMKLSNDVMTNKYIEMKKRCIETVRPLIINTSSVNISKIFFDSILHQKLILDNAIIREKVSYEALVECKNTTIATIGDAINLATCTIYFDINSLYNNVELDKLLC